MSPNVITREYSRNMLVQPLLSGQADSLDILTGYATPVAVARHLRDLNDLSLDFNIRLIIGMTNDGAVTQSYHELYRKLASSYFIGKFVCRYMPLNSCSNAKLYIWKKDSHPVEAWCSSANYTQSAFYSFQHQEIAATCDPIAASSIFDRSFISALDCRSSAIDGLVANNEQSCSKIGGRKYERFSWSLLARHDELPSRSGLNWGQREGRDPDQAYIRVPSKIYKTKFFPEKGEFFTVKTDDGVILTCVRAQDNGKAIETPLDNSELGKWFRHRIGLKEGQYISAADLERYGNTTIEFEKLNEEEFRMHF